MTANANFEFLSESYLFAEVGRRVREFQSSHPELQVIRMDIGDVTLPIVAPVAEAMNKAVADMTSSTTFRGYGPEQGYDFLRNAIAENDYVSRGVEILPDEIFVSDGAKCDIGNLTDIYGVECRVAIPDPVYPVYVDSNIMAGRTPENGKMIFLDCKSSNDYKPVFPWKKPDVIYLCSPNNPTGCVLDKKDLEAWVGYADEHDAIIIFDSAYESFIREPGLPKSIYEIEGAKKVAVEVRSFSKTAGFTGLRCGYTVIPRELKVSFPDGKQVEFRKLWLRRQTTKFNGASYVVQRGAEAVYSEESRPLVKANIDYYLENSAMLRKAFESMGYGVSGGVNSPYVWVRDPEGRSSWDLFDLFLKDYHISTTPGCGFGSRGEGCIRLTGFNTRENTRLAIKSILKGI